MVILCTCKYIQNGRGEKGTLSAAKKYLKKVICVFAPEPYGLLQMLFGIFVRSVEDGLEPSQTYDEVNKLLLLLLLLLSFLTLKKKIRLEPRLFSLKLLRHAVGVIQLCH